MMKKKALLLFLALALCMGLTIPAMAANPPGLETVSSITINITDVPGLTATLTNVLDHYIKSNVTYNNNFSFSEASGSVSFNQDVTVFMPTDGLHYGESEYYATNVKAGEVIAFDLSSSFDGFLLYTNGSKVLDARPNGEFRGVCFEQYPVVVGLSDAALASQTEYSKVSIYELTGTSNPPADAPSSWAVEQVNAAIAAGLVPESLQSKYTAATTRAEFCALAVALYETVTGKEIAERAQFDDTTDVNVLKMAGLGVVNGVGDNKFAPGSKLTREQAATMLSRLASVIGKPLTEQAPTFADSASVSIWAATAVGQMQATGIMGGVGNNAFSPATDYTREQSMITMKRLFDIVK